METRTLNYADGSEHYRIVRTLFCFSKIICLVKFQWSNFEITDIFAPFWSQIGGVCGKYVVLAVWLVSGFYNVLWIVHWTNKLLL